MLKDFHHYKGNDLSRSEKVERKVVQLLLENKIPDEVRESSIVWELKHSSGCIQCGRILAQKRNLDVELVEIICVLHDIYVIVEGKYKDHAKLGSPIAEKLLREVGGFTGQEIKTIVQAVAHHSEKDVYSDDPYVEIAKDADVLDCSLYKGAEGFYRLHKPEQVFKQYASRIEKIREELGLDTENVWRD
ncbi:MAG: HD domain-containing protein [Candidatus Aenigmarchaeota archaeon]|nr:HD domain-containing protein [Candidatus Aenigmarchaeota archaeon]